jgi:uncharacterized protein YecE (DUF72 family)
MERIIKWETLKQKAQDVVYNRCHGNSFPTSEIMSVIVPALLAGRHPLNYMEELCTEALKRIEQWDVRCYRRLIDLFPEIVKGSYTKIEATTNAEDDWVVVVS